MARSNIGVTSFEGTCLSSSSSSFCFLSFLQIAWSFYFQEEILPQVISCSKLSLSHHFPKLLSLNSDQTNSKQKATNGILFYWSYKTDSFHIISSKCSVYVAGDWWSIQMGTSLETIFPFIWNCWKQLLSLQGGKSVSRQTFSYSTNSKTNIWARMVIYYHPIHNNLMYAWFLILLVFFCCRWCWIAVSFNEHRTWHWQIPWFDYVSRSFEWLPFWRYMCFWCGVVYTKEQLHRRSLIFDEKTYHLF